ncbi:hypothetical protein [Paenibacillus sp. FSL W8-1287]|uniref:hypothetical protein n=1 Tax=Paenibacillus sp. FSL W8-1287 TaxID=2954653 RepID=UPI0030CF7FDE
MIIEIGQKVFYEIDTGNILAINPSARGDEFYVKDRTIDEIIELYPVLRERDRATFDVIELKYGQYDEDFSQAKGWWVNPETKKLHFDYRDPNEPEGPPAYRKPLTEEIEELKQADIENKQAIAELTMMIAAPMA